MSGVCRIMRRIRLGLFARVRLRQCVCVWHEREVAAIHQKVQGASGLGSLTIGLLKQATAVEGLLQGSRRPEWCQELQCSSCGCLEVTCHPDSGLLRDLLRAVPGM